MKFFKALRSKFSIIGELFTFLGKRKKWWLMPIVIVLVMLALLIIIGGSSPSAPFIYTLF